MWFIASSIILFFSVQFSCSVVSDSLRPHEPQHARLPYPSPTPGVHPNPCPLSRWWHPTISSSVVPFSSCPQSFPASGSFPFASGGQSIGASASASVLPMNIQGWFPHRSKKKVRREIRKYFVLNENENTCQKFGRQLWKHLGICDIKCLKIENKKNLK